MNLSRGIQNIQDSISISRLHLTVSCGLFLHIHLHPKFMINCINDVLNIKNIQYHLLSSTTIFILLKSSWDVFYIFGLLCSENHSINVLFSELPQKRRLECCRVLLSFKKVQEPIYDHKIKTKGISEVVHFTQEADN